MIYELALFTGQGSQSMGMGKSLYENSSNAKDVFDRISEATQTDVAKLCFETEMDILSRTENSQLAIFTHSLAALETLKAGGIEFSACAGFSLGEYTALVASGVLSIEDGAKIVQMRGKLMQKSADETAGGMAAILGLDDEAVEHACEDCGGIVLPVNYNCPGQLVIAGEPDALNKAIENCKSAGARRAVALAVSGAFHTPILNDAAEKLAEFASDFTFNTPLVPVYTNITGEILHTNDYPNHLKTHMVSPVRWKHLMSNALESGLKTGLELGSGKTLTGFARKISKELDIKAVETMENALSVLNSSNSID